MRTLLVRRLWCVAGAVAIVVALGGCGSGGGGGSGAKAKGTNLTKFCDEADSIEAQLAAKQNSARGTASEDDFKNFAAKTREAADDAPAEMKDDLEKMAAFFDSAAKEGAAGVDEPVSDAAQEADKRITDFRDEHCSDSTETTSD